MALQFRIVAIAGWRSKLLLVLLVDEFACLLRILCLVFCIDADHHQAFERKCTSSRKGVAKAKAHEARDEIGH